jgi:hypothetical protein
LLKQPVYALFRNVCKVRRESCMKSALIEIAYEGACDRCKTVNCQFYGTCIDDGIETKCVCQEKCADVMAGGGTHTHLYRVPYWFYLL